jgi:hypothetical protein
MHTLVLVPQHACMSSFLPPHFSLPRLFSIPFFRCKTSSYVLSPPPPLYCFLSPSENLQNRNDFGVENEVFARTMVDQFKVEQAENVWTIEDSALRDVM